MVKTNIVDHTLWPLVTTMSVDNTNHAKVTQTLLLAKKNVLLNLEELITLIKLKEKIHTLSQELIKS